MNTSGDFVEFYGSNTGVEEMTEKLKGNLLKYLGEDYAWTFDMRWWMLLYQMFRPPMEVRLENRAKWEAKEIEKAKEKMEKERQKEEEKKAAARGGDGTQTGQP